MAENAPTVARNMLCNMITFQFQNRWVVLIRRTTCDCVAGTVTSVRPLRLSAQGKWKPLCDIEMRALS